MFMRQLRILIILISLSVSSFAQQLAFPDAEGFGRYASGGRGGEVYHVTNLNDDGSGSFREAVSQSNRTVVFDVGGVIDISSRIVIKKNITIAGQSAPGQGITIYGNGLAFNDDSGNNIIRHIRIRMGINGDSGKDAIQISAGQNYIFDHVSVSWGRDGTVDINGSGIDNVSLQDCIVAQGLHSHSTGGLVQSGKTSIVRCLYIDNHTRNPKVKGVNEFINNVVYNWRVAGYILGDTEGESAANIMNNYFIAGPETGDTAPFNRSTPSFHAYVSENWYDSNVNGILDGSDVDSTVYGSITFEASPYDYPGVEDLKTPSDAYNYVISNVGASRTRDEVDGYLIEELTSLGTKGTIISNESENPIEGAVGKVYGGSVPADTDLDGMPDEWETNNGLDMNDPEDRNGDLDNDGYTNLEEYLNELALKPSDYLIPPSNLTTEVLAYDQIKLSWQDNSDNEVGYYLERSVNNGEYVRIASIEGNEESYGDKGLSEKTVYSYRIQAYTSTMQSDYAVSNEATTFSEDGTPFAPELTFPENNTTDVAPASAVLKWSGGNFAGYFNVYLGNSKDNMSLVGSNITDMFLNLSQLEEHTTYFWKVDAINEYGTTSSDTLTFTTKDLYISREVAYYAFDETNGETAIDSSAYGNHGTVINITPARTTGCANNAIDLTAGVSNSGIEILHQLPIEFNDNSFSVAFWVKAISGTNGYLFNKGVFTTDASTGAVGKWYGMESKSGTNLYFSVDDDKTKTQLAISNETFFTGNWVHITVIRDITEQKLKIYRNGELVQSTDDKTGEIGNDENLYIGNCTKGDTNFPGIIDEFHMYNYALSPEEITALAVEGLPAKTSIPQPTSGAELLPPQNIIFSWEGSENTDSYDFYAGTAADNLSLKAGGLTTNSYELTDLMQNTVYYWRVDAVNSIGTTTGPVWSFATRQLFDNQLVGYWKTDEGEGATVADNSGYENTGTAMNLDPLWEAGIDGNCLNMSPGSNDSHVKIPHKPQLYFDTNSFTLSLWVKAETKSNCYFIAKGFSPVNGTENNFTNGYGIKSDGEKTVFIIDDEENTSQLSVDNQLVFTGAWVNIVAVRDTSSHHLKLYVNGALKGETDDLTGNIGQQDDLIIGNSSTLDMPFQGSIDDVRIYNYALSLSEIESLQFENNSTGVEDIVTQDDFVVYPNPFSVSATVRIILNHPSVINLALFDLHGERVRMVKNDKLCKGVHAITINGTGLPPGTYIIRLRKDNESKVLKVNHLE